MWETANDMITWILCNSCWAAIDLQEYYWVPIRCKNCQKGNKCIDWIYWEQFFKKAESITDKLERARVVSLVGLKAYASYNAEIQWIKFNEKQIDFIAEFCFSILLEYELNKKIW